MADTKFTPGPWDDDWWYSIIRDLHNQPGLERGEDDSFGYPGWDGDNTANANLIAAAPDLFEALERCAMKLRRCMTHAGNADFAVEACCEEFDAALAKARGES